jgi:hypothetical protein
MPLPSNCGNSLQRRLTMIRMFDPEQAEVALNKLEQQLSA